MLPVPLVIMASGRGSGFEAIHAAIEKGELPAKIIAVLSDQPEARVLSRAQSLGIPHRCLPFPRPDQGSLLERRLRHEEACLKVLTELQPRFLVLAGYMRILTQRFIEAFRSEQGYTRIVNIHPSLLPAFPGIHSYAQAYRYGVQVTGVTVHLVEDGVDTGPICAQEAFSVDECRSESEVEQKGLAIEHRLYPQTLKWLIQEKFEVECRLGGRVRVRPN